MKKKWTETSEKSRIPLGKKRKEGRNYYSILAKTFQNLKKNIINLYIQEAQKNLKQDKYRDTYTETF